MYLANQTHPVGDGAQGTVYNMHEKWVLKIGGGHEAAVAGTIQEDQSSEGLLGFPVVAWAVTTNDGLGEILMVRLSDLKQRERAFLDRYLLPAGAFPPHGPSLDPEKLRKLFGEADSQAEWQERVLNGLIQMDNSVCDWELLDVNSSNLLRRGSDFVLVDLGSLEAPRGASADRLDKIEGQDLKEMFEAAATRTGDWDGTIVLSD